MDQIIQTWHQLTRNTQRIPTTLGVVNHGYLALLLVTNGYLNIRGTDPFTRPTHPGIFALIVSRGATPGDVRTRLHTVG